ncbi:MAG: hypothetical protein J1E61_07660 [Lachnospiraceae bacterium]|nr:hypothetical protein [Lachnospiraceae bacterium]
MEVYKGVRIYHSLARFSRKKVLEGRVNVDSPFLHAQENRMGNIQEALSMFQHMTEYKYKFVISHKKVKYEIELNFHDKDFFHIAGLQHLKDIDIPRNPKMLYEKIENGKIDDTYLSKSTNYTKVRDSYANIKSRIYGVKFLEEFLDSKNLICQYVKYKNRYSNIKADYFIKSVVHQITAYIFLKKRTGEKGYCICSFFIEPKNTYEGINVYWLYKSKIRLIDNYEEVLYDRLKKDIAILY